MASVVQGERPSSIDGGGVGAAGDVVGDGPAGDGREGGVHAAWSGSFLTALGGGGYAIPVGTGAQLARNLTTSIRSR